MGTLNSEKPWNKRFMNSHYVRPRNNNPPAHTNTTSCHLMTQFGSYIILYNVHIYTTESGWWYYPHLISILYLHPLILAAIFEPFNRNCLASYIYVKYVIRDIHSIHPGPNNWSYFTIPLTPFHIVFFLLLLLSIEWRHSDFRDEVDELKCAI